MDLVGTMPEEPRLSAPIDLPEMLTVLDDEIINIGRYLDRQVEAGKMSGNTRRRRIAVMNKIRDSLTENQFERAFIEECLKHRATIEDCLVVLRGWYPDAKKQMQGRGI